MDKRQFFILWCIDPLVGNDSVNTFPREPTPTTIVRLLLNNGSVNTPKTIRNNRKRCFLWGTPRRYITGSSKRAVSCQKLREFSWRTVDLSELLLRTGSSRRWLRRNDKELIRLWKEDFMCNLKSQWHGYNSVARVWLVKTENRSACLIVNCKMRSSAIALYCL
jgi:hypothetical protein